MGGCIADDDDDEDDADNEDDNDDESAIGIDPPSFGVCVVVTAVISTHISCSCGGVSFAATANSVCSNTPYSAPTDAVLTRCTDDHSKWRCACDKRT
jgi:hypothetical protein